MNKLLIILMFLISFNLFSYETTYGPSAMCGEYANFRIYLDSFPNHWKPRIVEIAQNSANWWNEAGSEHHLYYAGIATTTMFISGAAKPEIYWGEADLPGPLFCDERSSACTIPPMGVFCAVTSGASIIIDNDHWPSNESSFRLQNTLTHEMGHLIGLDHTDDYSDYHAILMGGDGYEVYRHLTEDDKYGVRDIYGKDDQKLRTTVSSKYEYKPTLAYSVFNSGSNYESYSKPQLVYQPNIFNNENYNYDYIVAWNKSNTREVNYQFAKDCGAGNKDLCSVPGTSRYCIPGSRSLTTPSIAISDNGRNGMIVWKQEKSDLPQCLADDIHYGLIQLSKEGEHDPSNCKIGAAIRNRIIYSKYNINKDCYVSNYDKNYNKYKSKTISNPTVRWINDWNRFVVFYPKLDISTKVWKIAYIVGDPSYGGFNPDPEEKYLGDLRTNWNPMAINCNQKYEENGIDKKACLLVFNEVDLSSNSYAHIAKTTYKILEPQKIKDPYDPVYNFKIKELHKSSSSLWDQNGYGHYSLANRQSEDYDEDTINVLNSITKAARNVVKNLEFAVYKSGNTWRGWSISSHNSSSSYYSRTGYSMVYNIKKQLYKYLWIEE